MHRAVLLAIGVEAHDAMALQDLRDDEGLLLLLGLEPAQDAVEAEDELDRAQFGGNPRQGLIEIEARRLNGTLHVQVTDNGPGLPSDSKSGTIVKEGIGLSNTEARLKQLYGDEHRLDLANTARGGLTVVLEIPFRHTHSDSLQI